MSLGSKQKLYDLLCKKIDSMVVKAQASSCEEAGEWVMDCMLFVSVEMTNNSCLLKASNEKRMKCDRVLKCGSAFTCLLNPQAPRLKKKIVLTILKMLAHIQKEIDNDPKSDVNHKTWVSNLKFGFDQYCCENTVANKITPCITVANFVQFSQKMFQKDMSKFTTVKSLLPYIIDNFCLSESIQELFKYAQEGLPAIRNIVGGDCKKYEQLIVEVALNLAVEEGKEKTAEYLLSCLPEINISKIDTIKEVLEKVGLWTSCFKAAVLQKSVKIADLLINRLVDMKISKYCAIAGHVKSSTGLEVLALCAVLKEFRELFFKIISEFVPPNAVSPELMKWLEACFDRDEESIRDMGWYTPVTRGFFEMILCGAVINGQVELVKILLNLEVPDVMPILSLSKQTLLLLARLNPHPHKEIEQLLLKIPDKV